MIKGQFGRVYKSVFVDMIEMACYTNHGVLNTIKLKFENIKTISITAHISGACIGILFAVIISYHLYAMLRTKCSQRHANNMNEQQLYETNNSALEVHFLLKTLENPHFQHCTWGSLTVSEKKLA